MPPQMPDFKTLDDSALATAEVPKPINENFWLTLTNLKKRVSSKIKQDQQKKLNKIEEKAKTELEQLQKAEVQQKDISKEDKNNDS